MSASGLSSFGLKSAGGIPSLEFIKKHVPIADVARLLDLRVDSSTAAHCWRIGNHQHGDRTASVWFSKRTNRGQCKVCDRHSWSNIDLTQLVLSCSTAEAIQWIAARFDVPHIQKKHLSKNGQPTLSRVGCGSHFEGLVRSGLWASLSGPEAKLLIVLAEFTGLRLSYSALQRFTGVGRARIPPALDHFKRMGLLKVNLGPTKDGLRGCSAYEVAWDDAGFQKLMAETFETTSREIAAEKELRQTERSQRRATQHTKVLLSSTAEPVKRFPGSAVEPANRTVKKGTA